MATSATAGSKAGRFSTSLFKRIVCVEYSGVYIMIESGPNSSPFSPFTLNLRIHSAIVKCIQLGQRLTLSQVRSLSFLSSHHKKHAALGIDSLGELQDIVVLTSSRLGAERVQGRLKFVDFSGR